MKNSNESSTILSRLSHIDRAERMNKFQILQQDKEQLMQFNAQETESYESVLIFVNS